MANTEGQCLQIVPIHIQKIKATSTEPELRKTWHKVYSFFALNFPHLQGNGQAMHVYKINYINNKVLSVRPADHIQIAEDSHYEASEEFIIMAFVKANDVAEAEEIGNELKDKFLRSKS